MHGSIFEVVCTNHGCKHREWNYDSLICPALATEDNKVPKADPALESRSRFEILRNELAERATGASSEEVEKKNAILDEKLATCEGAERVIPTKDLPKCSKCGSLVRPGVVWFGESPRNMDIIEKAVNEADLCLVVGTSFTVSGVVWTCSRVDISAGASRRWVRHIDQ